MMPRQIGTVTRAHLAQIAAAGVHPKEAVDRILAEAKERHPEVRSVVLQRQAGGADFDIIAID
jgi:hypothetical protein